MEHWKAIGLGLVIVLFVGSVADVEANEPTIESDTTTADGGENGAYDFGLSHETGTQNQIDERTNQGESELDEEQLLTIYEMQLEEHGVAVQSIDVVDGVIYIEYHSTETTEEAIAREIGYVSGGYTVLVEEGMEYPLEATITAPTGEAIGTFSAEPEWAHEYNNEEITEEEYMERVFETIIVY